MKVIDHQNVPAVDVNVEGAKAAKIRKILTPNEGTPNFAMRIFELDIHGCTPYHTHEWEHEIFVLSGKGLLINEHGDKIDLYPGVAALIPPNEKHQFQNASSETFKFMCLVPNDYA
ncbi:MAG: cupin domain-containing protein [Cyanobacteriota bacterium]